VAAFCRTAEPKGLCKEDRGIVAGSIPASIIDVPHFGQGGRTIAREDAWVENDGMTVLLGE
jgi:hypothetical protein